MSTSFHLRSSDVWINALEAAESLAAIAGGFTESKVMLADRLLDERLSLRVALYADNQAMNKERNISKRVRRAIELGAKVGQPPNIMHRNYEIPFSLWNRSYDRHADVASWTWADGAFLISYTEGMYLAGPRRQARMWGAQFKTSEIANLIKLHQRPTSGQLLMIEQAGAGPKRLDLVSSKSKVGVKVKCDQRRPTPKQWELIIGDLESLANNGMLGDKFGAPTWGTQAAVALELTKRAAALGIVISRTTAKRRADALLKQNSFIHGSKPHEPI